MIGIDSNVLVRYLAQDDPVQSAAADRLLEERLDAANPGFVSLVALAETAWVMKSVYGAERDTIVVAIRGLLSAPQLHVQDAEAVWRALATLETVAADFADALTGALTSAHGGSHTVTFDARAARLPGFRPVERG